jgi:Na+-driven multidrug efflux pump
MGFFTSLYGGRKLRAAFATSCSDPCTSTLASASRTYLSCQQGNLKRPQGSSYAGLRCGFHPCSRWACLRGCSSGSQWLAPARSGHQQRLGRAQHGDLNWNPSRRRGVWTGLAQSGLLRRPWRASHSPSSIRERAHAQTAVVLRFLRSTLQQLVGSSPLDKEISRLALPALGALALDPLMTLVDTLFVARIPRSWTATVWTPDPAPLAGVGVSTMVFNFSIILFQALAIATTPIVARAGAAGNHAEASRALARGLWLACSLGLVLAVTIFLGCPWLLGKLGASGSVLQYGVAYIRTRTLAMPFVVGSMVLSGAFRGYRDTATPFRISLATNVLNFFGDALLIFPLRLHVIGAAAATALAQILTFCCMFLVLTRRRPGTAPVPPQAHGPQPRYLVHRSWTGTLERFQHWLFAQSPAAGILDCRDLRRPPSWAQIRPLLSAGGLVTIRTVSILVTLTYATSTTAYYGGPVASSAFEVLRQVWVMTAMLCDSLSVAAQSMVASALGGARLLTEKDCVALGVPLDAEVQDPSDVARIQARLAANRIVQLSLRVGLLFGVLWWSPLGHQLIPHIFSPNAAVREATRQGTRVIALMAPLNAITWALDGVAIGAMDYAYIAKAIFCASASSLLALEFIRRQFAAALTCGKTLSAQHVVVQVWHGLNMLMVGRATAMLLRFLMPQSRLPPLRALLKPSKANSEPGGIQPEVEESSGRARNAAAQRDASH